MRSRNPRPKFLAILVAVAVCWAAWGAPGMLAKGAREFVGFYRILQATNQDDQVEVRISLRVFNYSEADVQDATIRLVSSRPHPPGAAEPWEKEQPAFQGVTLHVHESPVVPPLEGTFTVPALEYARWLRGAGPHFVVDYQDASGNPQHRTIELMRGH